MEPLPQVIAFEGARRLGVGPLAELMPKIQKALDRQGKAPVLVFDLETSALIDLDFRREPPAPPGRPGPAAAGKPGPGRPRLGVVAREVTLLPRHWEWLGDQPGGASVTLRKLVDAARSASAGIDRVRKARESAYRFLVAMAGDRPGFEEATRALFAGDQPRFMQYVERWPADIRNHASALMARTLP